MIEQIKLLTKLKLCNQFRLNEFRHTKDRRFKRQYCLMSLLWLLIIVMMTAYVCGCSYGFISMQMGHLVPAVLTMSAALITFLFTFFQAGPVLFEKNAYERLAALPVSIHAMIISSFLSMYFVNMLLGILIMLPGLCVYSILEHPGITFYLFGIISIFFLPLLPLTAASVLGALITGISSRWKRKNLAAIGLTLIFVCLFLIGSLQLSGKDEGQLKDLLQQLAVILEQQIRHVYPPALWLSKALLQGRGSMLLLFLFVSMGSFLIFLEILQHYYKKICLLLNGDSAKGIYHMEYLKAKSPLRSMVEKEIRRYFSSVPYVTNTLIGGILMVFLSGAVFFTDIQTISRMFGIPGFAERTLPIILGMLTAMMPISACSISMEGKNWWIIQTLPITKKALLQSKIWTNIIITLPFYMISEILLLVVLKPNIIYTVCLFIVPAVYMVFNAILGILLNLKFPVLEWDNEVKVVKQSFSVLLSMLAGIISGIIPLGILIYFHNISVYIVYAVVTLIFMLLICILQFSVRESKM